MKVNIIILISLFIGCSKNSIPTTLNECYSALNSKLSDSTIQEFKAMPENEAVSSSHFGLGMWIRNNWGLWKSSELSEYFNELGLKHPDDISSVILTSYHRTLNNKDVGLEKQIEFYKDYWEGKTKFQLEQKEKAIKFGEANLNWLKRNGIKLRDLELDGRKRIYDCDSTMLLIKESGDTTNLWTQGTEGYIDTTRLLDWTTKDNYKTNNYIDGIGEDGRVRFMELKPNSFVSRNDSLFEYVEMYTISNDSVQQIREAAYSLSDFKETAKYLETNLNKNKKPVYKLIFHPNLFDSNRIYTENIQNDSIKLESKWLIDSRMYYSIRIENQSGKYKTSYAYIIDENHKFIKYEGCSSEVSKRLNDKHKIE